jgi:hypothetical protein
MRTRELAACLAATALIGACGGDEAGTTATTAAKPAATAAADSGADLQRFAVSDELDGFSPTGDGTVETDPDVWLTLNGDTSITPEQLAKAGFVAGLRRDLRADDGMFGVSLVSEFKTPEQAQAELERATRSTDDQKNTPFEVPGLEGAVGFSSEGGGGAVGDNVAFVRDDRLIAVGRMRDPEMSADESQATVIAAAEAIAEKTG